MSGFRLNIRFLHSKGALVALVLTAFPFAILASPIFLNLTKPYILLSALSFPIAGCLSDIYVRRYVVIRYSLWLVWAFVIIYNILLIFQQYVRSSTALNYIEIAVSAATFIGMTGIWSNIFQFGIDQLTDASTSDITSFTSWYVWTFFLILALSPFLQACSCGDYNKATSYYILPLIGTIALVTNSLFSKDLVKEPPTQNPFKLIYQVLKYAVKNKYPRLRSAFTYWEEEPYSRIDLGKGKYGGPFTTEQVEDVKTFFRLVALTAASISYLGIVYILYILFRDYTGFYRNTATCGSSSVSKRLFHCFRQTFVQQSAPFSMILLIPFFEFILYPFLMRCHCATKLKLKHKMFIGTFLLVVYEVIVIAFEVTNVLLNTHQQNSTCLLNDSKIGDTQIDYKWLTLLQPVFGVAVYTLLSSYLELLCAQSPYSMKGVLIGIFYAVGVVSIAASVGLLQAFHSSIMELGRKCRLWLYTALLGLTAALMCIQFVSLKCYKLRRRDDILRNNQMFAEDYFNKYLSPKHLAQFKDIN